MQLKASDLTLTQSAGNYLIGGTKLFTQPKKNKKTKKTKKKTSSSKKISKKSQKGCAIRSQSFIPDHYKKSHNGGAMRSLSIVHDRDQQIV